MVHAIPASPWPVAVIQPDGANIMLRVHGDEYFHWYEDLAGFTVVLDRGTYVYARLGADDKLEPTAAVVGRTDPRSAGLDPGILPSSATQARLGSEALPVPSSTTFRDNPPALVPAAGTVKNLVVLCRFSDHTAGADGRPRADYDTLFNVVGGDPEHAPTGSVKDCFTENSYGIMTLESTVAAWVTLPNTEAYYTDGQDGLGSYPNNAQGMVEDALDQVDALVDFGPFDTDNDGYIDAITFIHSGYGAETGGGSGNWIWSHRWSLSALPGGRWTSDDTNGAGDRVKVYDYHTEPALWGTSGTGITHIGVVVHETGHFFGLPDLYDTNGGGSGIGSYGMMANSWGFDGSQRYPPHFCAWSKIVLGWVTPTIVDVPDTYTVPQVETNDTIYQINNGYPSGEYLLIENRQPIGFDAAMPQGGLAIWHIDENKCCNTDQGYPGQSGWPGNNNHYKIALLQADGNYNLEHGQGRGDAGDVYHGGGVFFITGSTVPNTNGYQNGNIIVTNNSVLSISASGTTMTFLYSTTAYVCGNGVVDPGETCDDGNTDPGDGCDGFCQDEGPANDSCINAIIACPGSYTGSTSGMNSDGSALCGESAASPDVWFSYTPGSSGAATAETCGATFYDSILSAHSDCPGTTSNQLQCDDDGCGVGDGPSTITFGVMGGRTYLIRVAGRAGSSGDYSLTITGPQCVGCNDGILNQGEDRIDCGGPCPPCDCLADGDCDNPDFCDGTESCDAFGLCQPGSDPCPGQPCDEPSDTCLPLTCDPPTMTAEGSRYLRIIPPAEAIPVALLVTGDSADPAVSCVSLYVQEDETLDVSPVFQTPGAWGTVHVRGAEILPRHRYNAQADCGVTNNPVLSDAVTATTWRFGEVNDAGVIDLNDVLAVLDGLQGFFENATRENVDLHPCIPDRVIDLGDLLDALDAFRGFASPCLDPCS